MVLTERRFKKSDFSQIRGNKVIIDSETDFVASNSIKGRRDIIDLDALVEAQGQFKKLVYGCKASGSALPFPDEWFDCYVSNLVLMLIDDAES